MECACIDMDVDERCEIIFDVTRIGVDPTRCCECNKTIEPGEEHTVEKAAFHGEIKFYRTCLDCRSARVLFCSFHYEMIWDDLHSEWSQYPDSIPYATISKLTKGAQETVCALIELIWENEEDNDDDDL